MTRTKRRHQHALFPCHTQLFTHTSLQLQENCFRFSCDSDTKNKVARLYWGWSVIDGFQEMEEESRKHLHGLSFWRWHWLGSNYIGARTDTTKQSGQTLDKEVDISHVAVYVSGYTETDPTAMLSPKNGRPSGANKVGLFRADSLARCLL